MWYLYSFWALFVLYEVQLDRPVFHLFTNNFKQSLVILSKITELKTGPILTFNILDSLFTSWLCIASSRRIRQTFSIAPWPVISMIFSSSLILTIFLMCKVFLNKRICTCDFFDKKKGNLIEYFFDGELRWIRLVGWRPYIFLIIEYRLDKIPALLFLSSEKFAENMTSPLSA